jgi:hypothetical protein
MYHHQKFQYKIYFWEGYGVPAHRPSGLKALTYPTSLHRRGSESLGPHSEFYRRYRRRNRDANLVVMDRPDLV